MIFVLYYLAIGLTVWLLFFSSCAYAEWKLERLALGHVPGFLTVAIASVIFILTWPVPVLAALYGWNLVRRVSR